jgi:hypothetical protein
MKRLLLVTGALAVMGVATAQAAGINVSWGTGCFKENAGGTPDPRIFKTFACATNTGSAVFVTSFALAGDQPSFVGTAAVVDLEADNSQTGLPDWWQFFNSGTCRQTSLSTSEDFTTAPGTVCVDPWSNLASGGVGAYQTISTSPPVPRNDPSTARLKIFYALADISPLVAGTEYYNARVTILYTKSTGTGSCAGCTVPVTIVLNSIQSSENTGFSEFLSDQIDNKCLNWQSSTVACAAVPTRNISWGQVKSLYR